MGRISLIKHATIACIVLTCVTLGIILIDSSALAADKKFTLRFQRYAGTELDEIYDKFSKDLLTASGGRIKVIPFRGGELVPNDQMMESVGKGTIDMCDGYGGYWPGKIDVGKIESGLPATWTTLGEATYFYYGKGFIELAREAYAEKNVYFLGPMFGGPYELLTKKPVSNLKDMKKLKIRASATVASVFKKFGIASVYLPPEELYVALATGTIDGVIYGSAFDYSQLKLQEVAKYYTQLGLLFPGYVDDLLINLDVWNSFPDDLKAIMEMSIIQLAFEFNNFVNFNVRDVMEKGIFHVSSLPAEDVAAIASAAQDVWNEEAAVSERNAKAITMLKDIARSAGRIK